MPTEANQVGDIIDVIDEILKILEENPAALRLNPPPECSKEVIEAIIKKSTKLNEKLENSTLDNKQLCELSDKLNRQETAISKTRLKSRLGWGLVTVYELVSIGIGVSSKEAFDDNNTVTGIANAVSAFCLATIGVGIAYLTYQNIKGEDDTSQCWVSLHLRSYQRQLNELKTALLEASNTSSHSLRLCSMPK